MSEDLGVKRMSDELISGEFKISSISSDTTGSRCTSFSRMSFDLPTSSPEQAADLKPYHRSSSISSQVTRRRSNLSFRDFVMVRQIGRGDIGRVYLCRSRHGADAGRRFAMKVVDNEALSVKKKTQRAETERKILRALNHPFLPSLFAEFEASNFSCVVIEYCSGGDLHSLRHKQPHNRFSPAAARFYAAEVLVALEYLHMMGVIYRDLKPENVLVRDDGHIMLTDFDLSLCADAVPAIESPSSSPGTSRSPNRVSRRSGYLTSPFACVFARFFRSKRIQTTSATRLFVAEPVAARSCSFVGTHEYVSPEVAAGGAHGNAVDWWALGIFLYEMIYGRTPFAGASNEATLRGILKKPLSFPTAAPRCSAESHARNLISGLLQKDPDKRLGSKRGAADIKTHPFFNGLNFALIRSMTPPALPPPPTAARDHKPLPFAGF
ncbi:hypothetical protein M569_09933 [Genlisea aurea]|uniref:non-specific serine/threonine protein kinase n=1 Tax=Genlisea aurea TaxID=192259 RepID=S8CDD1_9LAMI|nr:hypothetical protein M569_09933 [Genlisea aurea]